MLLTEFLERYALYRRFNVAGSFWDAVPSAIQLDCEACKKERTFTRLLTGGGTPARAQPQSIAPSRQSKWKANIYHICYQCGYCGEFGIEYIVLFDDKAKYAMKVGQLPPWKISTPKNLKKLLGEHEQTFTKGLICESQGFGIGAYSYYRRIVELTIDQLLSSISDLLQGDDKAKYEQALELVKRSIVAQEKIDLVKELLPASLRPNGMNPLGILHSTLSEGLHSLSDDDCLATAEAVRTALLVLVNQIATQKEASKGITEAMQKMLDRKGRK